MLNRKLTWIALIAVIVIIGFVTINQYLSIAGGSKTETITIEQVSSSHDYKIKASLKPDQHVHNLKVVVRGSINDTAMLGDVKLLPGKVYSVIYNSDWYSPDYDLEYKPYKATEGNLKVELIFSYLN